MPRLPSPDDANLSFAGPSRGLTAHQAVQTQGVMTTPDLDTGRVLSEFGKTLAIEAERMDDTVATDALNKLREKRLQLTYGDGGFTKLQGGDVVKRPITDEFPAAFKQAIEAGGTEIHGAHAKAKYQQAAAAELSSFQGSVFVHAAQQTEKYHDATEKAELITFGKAGYMAAMAGDVIGAATTVGEARSAAERVIKRKGLVGPQAEAYRQSALGTVHADILTGLLDSENPKPALASEWLKTSRKEMTVDQAKHFDKLVKADTAWAAGDTRARELIESGKTQAEAEAALAAEAKKAGGKEFYSAGLHTLGTLAAAKRVTFDAAADKAQNDINRGAPWARVRTRYIDQMDPSVVAAFDQRAKAQAQEGGVKTDFEAYYTLSKMPPEEFVKADLRQYVGKISDSNLRTLADRQDKIREKPEKEMKDTVTLQQQLSMAHNELGLGNTADGRRKRGMFDSYIVDSIRAQENASGKRLNDDEREAFIKKAMVSQKGGWFSADKRYYEVAGTKDAKTFVPDIPPADREAIVKILSRGGKTPTEDAIVARYKKANGLE